MSDILPEQEQKLQDIAKAMGSTEYGRAWPNEYKTLFRLWGFFNAIYDTIYTGDNQREEWKRVGSFSIDHRFSNIWNAITDDINVFQLANLSCVGSGKHNYEPVFRTRKSFEILRDHFNINHQGICQGSKCDSRQARCIDISLDFNQPYSRSFRPYCEMFNPFGATLLIIYQVRCNLFHGSKYDITGPNADRDATLVRISSAIMQKVLEETHRILSPERNVPAS